MKQNKETIKSYFNTGDRPTQEQYHDTWDSFWHKDELVENNNLSATNGNSFTGNLDFQNIFGTYHDLYDLGTSGPITFTIGDNPIINASHSLKLVADGTTELMSETNLEKFIGRKGLPENRILGSGDYEIFFYYTNNGASFSIVELAQLVTSNPIGNLPFLSDAVVYFNRFLDNQVAVNGNNEVTQIENLIDPSNPLTLFSGPNAVDNDIEKVIEMQQSSLYTSNDVFHTKGESTVTFVLDVPQPLTSQATFNLYRNPSTGGKTKNINIRSSARDAFFYDWATGVNFLNFGTSSYPSDHLAGKVIVTLVVDNINGTAKAYSFNENIIQSKVFNFAAVPTESDLINAMAITNLDTSEVLKVRAYAVWNRIMTDSEVSEVETFFNNQFNVR